MGVGPTMCAKEGECKAKGMELVKSPITAVVGEGSSLEQVMGWRGAVSTRSGLEEEDGWCCCGGG